MKKFAAILLMLAVCLMAGAQTKLTPQAQLKVMKMQAQGQGSKFKVQGSKGKVQGSKGKKAQTIQLIVKVEKDGKAQTLAQMMKCGAKVKALIGDQVAISLPVDSVESLSQIDGVVRIDAGSKPKLMTDKSREVTGTSHFNGPSADAETLLTGEGVTICLIDIGFDYQHSAFKNADGTSRIKCVYLMNDDGGNEFVYRSGSEWGDVEMTFPGSVYDTPELIASLTTDSEDESHGTHTASIAAGSLSPQGFGGMAPKADIVLIPLGELEEESLTPNPSPKERGVNSLANENANNKGNNSPLFGRGAGGEADDDDDEDMDENAYTITAISFAMAYAQQTGKPVVLSVSMGTYLGPHDGSSSVCEAIEDASDYLIPVFSSGNSADCKNYIGYDFTDEDDLTMSTFLNGVEEGWDDDFSLAAEFVGYVYNVGDDDEVTLQLSFVNDELEAVWETDPITYTRSDEAHFVMHSADYDSEMAKVYDGDINVLIGDGGDGSIVFKVETTGDIQGEYLPIFSVDAPLGAHLNMWDEEHGFEGGELLVDGSSDCSGSDWTCTENVISVGAWCANLEERSYTGDVEDINESLDDDEEPMVEGDIAPFSSYGVMPNGVVQPTVCAPGVNVVAALNHYRFPYTELYGEQMQWQGFPYGADSGTSMSCPTVAGIIALWLQACPTLTFQQVKEVLENSSDNDDFTAADPTRWGYGKVNAVAGLDYIQQNILTAIKEIASSESANDRAIYDLQGRRVSHPSRGLYIVGGRKVVVK